MKSKLNGHDILPLELNCLLVAVDSELDRQEDLFSDFINSTSQDDRDNIRDVHDRIVALNTVRAKLHHLWNAGGEK